jgi:hypothetical protein
MQACGINNKVTTFFQHPAREYVSERSLFEAKQEVSGGFKKSKPPFMGAAWKTSLFEPQLL